MNATEAPEKLPPATPLIDRERALGATFTTYFDCTMPERFASLETEYRFARETAALVDKNYSAFIQFTGPDRVRYLNAILTSDIRDASPPRGVLSLLLNPQGHILAEVETYPLSGHHLLVSYEMIRKKLIPELDRYIIMDDVTLDDVTSHLAVLAVEGPSSAEVLRSLGGSDLDSLVELGFAVTTVASLPVTLVRRSPGDFAGFECIVARDRVGELWDALLEAVRAHGGGPIGYATLSTVRLEAGTPWFGYDFDESLIPNIAGLEKTHIDFSKGCYVGQEIVERVRSQGHPNRARVGLKFSGSSIPEHLTKLTVDGTHVGQITRAAFSPALKGVIGMGYLRLSHTSPGSTVEYPGGTATVIELPLKR